MPTANTAPADTVTSRTVLWGRLALGTVAGAVLFTVAWIVLSFVSDGYTIGGDHIAPYSNLTQPISGLGMGDTAPYMNAAFVLSGLLFGAGFLGFFRAVEEDARSGACRPRSASASYRSAWRSSGCSISNRPPCTSPA
ncbi:hypothetical protein ACFQQB_11325 [Nonomuraea rubra]|uniref:hypothetical protein n=1 Tax=Nonomuraea rubra TaxID=46180 RepID=UPI00360FEC7C